MSVHYVAEAADGGDDGNSGLSELLPWATISKVNGHSLSAGESVVFHRGDVWRETLAPASSGSEGNPITFGNYGSGALPQILASTAKSLDSDWTDEGGSPHLWYATMPSLTYMALEGTPPVKVTNNMIRDGAWMTRVVNKTDVVSENQCWWDIPNLRCYVLGTASAPTSGGHTFEFPTRAACYNSTRTNITLDGIEFAYSPHTSTTTGGVNVGTGGANFTIQNCVVHHCFGQGIHIGHANGSVTQDNVCYSNGRQETWQGMNIWIDGWWDPGPAVDGAIVRRNLCYDAGTYNICTQGGPNNNILIEQNECYGSGATHQLYGYGIGVYSSSSPTPQTNIVVRYNYVHDDYNANFFFSDASDGVEVYGNIFANAGNVGSPYAADYQANFYTGSVTTDHTNFKFYNNTLYQPAVARARSNFLIPNSTCNGALVKNNIFYNADTTSGSYTYQCDLTHATPPTVDYNCHYSAMGGSFLKIENVARTWAARGAGFEDHGINDDPDFTDASGGDFTLQATSPCIDTGVDLGDLYRMALRQGSTWPGQ